MKLELCFEWKVTCEWIVYWNSFRWERVHFSNSKMSIHPSEHLILWRNESWGHPNLILFFVACFFFVQDVIRSYERKKCIWERTEGKVPRVLLWLRNKRKGRKKLERPLRRVSYRHLIAMEIPSNPFLRRIHEILTRSYGMMWGGTVSLELI